MSHLDPFVPKGVVYLNENDKRRLETRKGVIQAGYILHTTSVWPAGQPLDRLLLLELQRLAVNQIYRCAGHFRDGEVFLQGANHKPPPNAEVQMSVDQMLAYLNGHWTNKPAVHLAAYAMWRVNWIHPFFGGNGRTARAFSYLVLCLHLGFAPPAAEKTIPQLLVENREPYYSALRKADAAWASGGLDVSAMEDLISSLLAQQLASFHFKALGKPEP